IANGDPFGVYKTTSEGGYFSSFIEIYFNNVRIDFFRFIGGLFFGVFTLSLLFENSVMAGCFHYLFFSNGLGIKSFMVIWIHGILEISSWMISATAGFIIAKSILFPGSYKRL